MEIKTQSPVVSKVQQSVQKSTQERVNSKSSVISLVPYNKSEIELLTRHNKDAVSAFDLCMRSLPDDSQRISTSSELVEIAENSGLHKKSEKIFAIILKNVRRTDKKEASKLRTVLHDIDSSIRKSKSNPKHQSDPLTFFYMARGFSPESILGVESKIESVFEDIAMEKANAVVKRVKELLNLQ